VIDRRPLTRRTAFQSLGAGSLALLAPSLSPARAQGSAATSSLDPWAHLAWAKGPEGQRRADLGRGRFLNPVFAGDRPDPAICHHGGRWYATFSSFDAYPGLLIWQSDDLVNWQPVAPALRTPIGSVWAPDLTHHDGRFWLYIPARTPTSRSIWVTSAERIEGPWTEPVDLGLPRHIDPAHVVREDGQRFLFLSGGDRVPLAADGLSTAGPVEHVYTPWRYPEDWVVESFAPEGPKLVKRDGWWYLVTAVGGTAGPPTGHMVIVARSRSLDGPWEDHPGNPIIRTKSAREKWWSRGHATLFEAPGGTWWLMSHGYENGFWTLGRQTLLEPAGWTDDGWPVALGGDLSAPLEKPLNPGPRPHGMALSDDFSADRMGVQWAFYDPAPSEAARVARHDGALILRAKGSTPSDSSPLCCIAGDQAYSIEAEVEVSPGAEGGLLLFYNRRLYAGLGLQADGRMVMHRYGLQRPRGDNPFPTGRTRLRLSNDRNILTIHLRQGDGPWRKFDVQMELSGYHHNVAYDFLSLRPALYAAGTGSVTFRDFRYQALP
jgi:beta-xylosidase